MMNSIEQQINDYLDASEDVMTIHKAPDFSHKIWRRYQQKKNLRHIAVAASITLVCFLLWFVDVPREFDSTHLVAQNQALEIKLAQVSFMSLTDGQQMIMSNWYAELELIDQNIEHQELELFDLNLWSSRTQLLTQMIDFYVHPFEMHEI